jgi:hypothetical protein
MKSTHAQSPELGPSRSPGGGSLEPNAAYTEYVRGLDDLPVLNDVVQAPPPALAPPAFSLAREVRGPSRPDCVTLRDTIRAELAALYAEYCGVPAALPPPRVKLSKRAAKRRQARALREGSRVKGVRSVQ